MKLIDFTKATKVINYQILNSPEATTYYIQRGQDRTSLNRELAFTNSSVSITTAISNVKVKFVCVEKNDSNKKRKFEENDGVMIEGLEESLGTKIGSMARSMDTASSKQEVSFKMSGMNGVVDLSDVMPGSQLYNLPRVTQETVIKDLTANMYTIRNTMHNDDFKNIVMKAAEPEGNLYDCIQELDAYKCDQKFYGSKSAYRLILDNIFCHLPIENFSEADYVINIWAPVLKFSFIRTCLWPHWGDTVPTH